MRTQHAVQYSALAAVAVLVLVLMVILYPAGAVRDEAGQVVVAEAEVQNQARLTVPAETSADGDSTGESVVPGTVVSGIVLAESAPQPSQSSTPSPRAGGDAPTGSVESDPASDSQRTHGSDDAPGAEREREGAGSGGAGSGGGGTGGGDSSTGTRCQVPAGASADQVLLVTGTGGARADVQACSKSGGEYIQDFAVRGHVGYGGVSGSKREGDGATPAGVYSLGSGFGVRSKPGSFPGGWTTVTKDHVWVDGSATKDYNTMQRRSEGYSGETLYQTPAYNYAQVINYNTARTPGKGSAIFLHVNTGSGKTAGCVSVSQSDLLRIFSWQTGGVQIAIQR